MNYELQHDQVQEWHKYIYNNYYMIISQEAMKAARELWDEIKKRKQWKK